MDACTVNCNDLKRAVTIHKTVFYFTIIISSVFFPKFVIRSQNIVFISVMINCTLDVTDCHSKIKNRDEDYNRRISSWFRNFSLVCGRDAWVTGVRGKRQTSTETEQRRFDNTEMRRREKKADWKKVEGGSITRGSCSIDPKCTVQGHCFFLVYQTNAWRRFMLKMHRSQRTK